MSYEILWIEGTEEDFKDIFSEDFFLKTLVKLKMIADSTDPFLLTDRVKGFPPNIRKMRIKDYRLFLDIRKFLDVIYCLAIKHRKEAYKTRTLKQILTISNNIKY